MDGCKDNGFVCVREWMDGWMDMSVCMCVLTISWSKITESNRGILMVHCRILGWFASGSSSISITSLSFWFALVFAARAGRSIFSSFGVSMLEFNAGGYFWWIRSAACFASTSHSNDLKIVNRVVWMDGFLDGWSLNSPSFWQQLFEYFSVQWPNSSPNLRGSL